MKKVVTHNGSFHPDDVFAVATLQLKFGKENIEVLRTRDEANFEGADFVVDVGHVYEPEKGRFDHHQPGAPVRSNGIPYAAFGLVWKEFGEGICDNKEVAEYIEEALAQPIDAGDNGIAIHHTNDFNVSPFELYSVINLYRPVIGEERTTDDAFMDATDFARKLLERMMAHSKADVAVKQYVLSVYENSDDKSLLVFDKPVDRYTLVPFRDVRVIVSPKTEEGDNWRASVIPIEYGTFDNRANFPVSWAGLRDDELVAASGIEGAVFCHKNLFIFASKTKEGAVEAAKLAK